MQAETDAVQEEPNKSDMTVEETEGPYELNVTRRSTSKERVAIYGCQPLVGQPGWSKFPTLTEQELKAPLDLV